MDEPKHEPTPTLAEARRRRVDIHDALVGAEEALSGPASGREDAWAREVIDALAHLRETIEEHIEVTERPGGLYDEILDNAHRLAGAVQRLREEHPLLGTRRPRRYGGLRTTPIGTTWSLGGGARRHPAALRVGSCAIGSSEPTSSGRPTTWTSAGSSSDRIRRRG